MIIILVVFYGAAAPGVIVHPETEPDLEVWKDRPDPNVLGYFSNSSTPVIANFVVIAPDWIITTQHQLLKPPTVTVAGHIYNCEYKDIWQGGPFRNADIQLVRLTKPDGSRANLKNYIPINLSRNEVGKEIVIGGYGYSRGAMLQKAGIVYGYRWLVVENPKDLWCTNVVEKTRDGMGAAGYSSDIIIANFDEPGRTIYEGTIADRDSGGGWFVKVNGQWRLGGLSRSVEIHSDGFESWFRNGNNPYESDPDYIDAVRVSSYSDWIQHITGVGGQGDISTNGIVNFIDYSKVLSEWNNSCNKENNWCNGADIAEPQGVVDMEDLSVVMDNWMNNSTKRAINFFDYSVVCREFMNSCDGSYGGCDGADIAAPFGIVDEKDLETVLDRWLEN